MALNWPILKFFDNKFFLPTNFYGVELHNDSAPEPPSGFDSIASAQTIHLVYYVAGTDKVSVNAMCHFKQYAL